MAGRAALDSVRKPFVKMRQLRLQFAFGNHIHTISIAMQRQFKVK
mgnify:CR=1 FL=1